MRSASDWKSNLGRGLGALLLVLVTMFATLSHAGQRLPFSIEAIQTKQHYRIATLHKYAFVYADRRFAFTAVPSCLDKSRYIVTANSDKFSRGSALLTLQSRVPLVVYVGYDRRYRTIPDWLRGYRLQPNLRLAMGDPKLGKTRVTYKLYRKEFLPGRIKLGGNLAKGEKRNFAMYTVIILEKSQDKCAMPRPPALKHK